MKEKQSFQPSSGGLPRKRYLVLEGKGSPFNLYRPSLNLSEEEYNRRLKEILQRGNFC